MIDSILFQGANLAYVQDLYEQYLQDPESIDSGLRTQFEALSPSFINSGSSESSDNTISSFTLKAALAAARLARYIRQRGHLDADVDPLHLNPHKETELDISSHAPLTSEVLERLPSEVVGGPIAEITSNARDAIARLRQVYSGSVGYEDEHIQVAAERYWLREAAESSRFFQDIDDSRKRELLQRLTEVDIFEDFLQKSFQGEKRFSIEGADALVPILDEIARSAALSGSKEVVLGMAHRGRLNVLAHVLGKPYESILSEFKHNIGAESTSVAGSDSPGWSGDVKYHLGYSRSFKEMGVEEMPIVLLPNPSHLEYVDPVVVGYARAAQEDNSLQGEPTQNDRAALPILIHGDSAFPGQGIVAETLNLSRLKGYNTGGTIHIIVNNQIGFTTLPSDSRSTMYASDLAKGFEIPIVHVNGDDPIACLAVSRMAFAYRETFRKDFLIDLIGYRRYGHNETDEPRTTQPQMYKLIDSHPRPREVWARELERQGIVSREEATEMALKVRENLRIALEMINHLESVTESNGHNAHFYVLEHPQTGVAEAELIAYNNALLERPENFHVNPKTEKQFYEPRRTAISQPQGIYWAHAELLAFASILADGKPIRLTGQDTERGTFDQRRIALYDLETERQYTPLQHLPQSRASFSVYNSPLSENAALGFEYGYSVRNSNVLTIWEAQFGDFANGAQVIIDQFLSAGNSKWGQSPSLTLLLPHGYEGQGSEHSSARIERYLQLCADANMRVVNCTTAAQYFHLLRMQAEQQISDPRPLIVFTPKSLLRDKNAAASLAELTSGGFQTVLDDQAARKNSTQITRLILCTGKVYMNLTVRDSFLKTSGVSVVRVEQLYPFPDETIQNIVASYPNLQEIVWLQEEPQNMGAWSFVEPKLRLLIKYLGWEGKLSYIGREPSSSTAEGSRPRHQSEQERILNLAVENIPSLQVQRQTVRTGRG